MKKKLYFVGALGALCLVSGVAAQQMPGLDAEAIEKRAQAGGAAASEFVKQILDRAAQQKSDDAQQVVDAGYRSLDNAPDALRKGSIAGVDLDEIVSGAKGQAHQGEGAGAPTFVAFASTSMPEESLKRMIADVSRAGGTVVFRGFMPDGSKTFLAQLMKVVKDDDAAHVKVDPRLFRAFNIQDVPAYVAVSKSFPLCDSLECSSTPAPYDIISGNVTTQYALQTFVDGNGPGANVARIGLRNLEHAE